MNRNRYLVLILGLALTAVLSCSAGELPLAPQLGGGPTTVDGALEPVDSTPVPVDSGTVPVDNGPVKPMDSLPIVPLDSLPLPPADTLGLPPQVIGSPAENVMVCDPQPYASATVEIGRAGGELKVGNHSLKIPERALRERVTITMEQVEGTANSVRFSPEGLHFEKPALLTLSYKGCASVKHWKRIVYTDELLNILETTLSYDFSSSSQVKGLINHFSRYAVAY